MFCLIKCRVGVCHTIAHGASHPTPLLPAGFLFGAANYGVLPMLQLTASMRTLDRWPEVAAHAGASCAFDTRRRFIAGCLGVGTCCDCRDDERAANLKLLCIA